MIALDVLRLTSFTLASALLAKRAHVPGDLPEDHEDNTYGLPGGAPIRRTLRRFFREQLKRTVGFVEKLGAQIPARFPSLADYNDPMASAMTPILGVYWDRAGKALNGRLGLDPDDWRVTDPNLHKAIANQSFRFCQATNATTDRLLSHALADLRHEFHQGLATEGETVEQLTKRVRSIFQSATRERALMIAQTEASRAVHTASEMSAIASGVVSAKRILLSANSCPVCVRVAEEAKQVPLGGSFGTVGNSSEYSDIRMPPIHPHCCLPETPVVAPMGVAGIMAHYDGPIVRIRFSEGSEVAVSPNHMLLTPSGFATASSLMEGDDVIRCLDRELPSSSNPDDDRKPPTIEEVVHSWAKPRGVPSRSVPVAPEYLHGDAALCQGDIHVVPAHGSLANDLDPASPKPPGDLSFFGAARKPLPLGREGRLAELLFALRDATDCGVGSLRESKASLRGHLRHADQIRFAAASTLDSCLNQSILDDGPGNAHRPGEAQLGLARLVTPDHLGQVEFQTRLGSPFGSGPGGNPGRLESVPDGGNGDSQRIGDCLVRFPGQVTTCHVVNVEFEHYSGPIYDIETETSLYLIGNGIASSNCRCSVSYILIDEAAPDVPAYVPRPKEAA